MRKGLIFLEVLTGFFLLISLGAAVIPLGAKAVETAARLEIRARCATESFFAVDFVTERIRNSLRAVSPSHTTGGDRYVYYAYGVAGRAEAYTFLAEEEKLKVLLYTGRAQPVTGSSAGIREDTAFVRRGGEPFFTVLPGGLVRLGFAMENKKPFHRYETETAVLPYAAWYKVGVAYE